MNLILIALFHHSESVSCKKLLQLINLLAQHLALVGVLHKHPLRIELHKE